MNAASVSSIVIREIDTADEMRAVEELQKEVWGIPDIEVVPLTQMTAARTAGGVLLGAFDGASLVGFVYGFVGREHGRTTHHSHMLAVLKEYRKLDLGFRLKAAQREQVLSQGIDEMSWTFDPLQSLNAYFNFSKLGVIARQYYVNFYGEEAASFLHQNGTDRLWVTWQLASGRVSERLNKTAAAFDPAGLPILISWAEGDIPVVHEADQILSGENAVIEIPFDINSVEHGDRELAVQWRLATRQAFTKALDAGFVVEDFCRVSRDGRTCGAYVLRRKTSS
jgi:predicted GNAT superfamily acetyltransferase